MFWRQHNDSMKEKWFNGNYLFFIKIQHQLQLAVLGFFAEPVKLGI